MVSISCASNYKQNENSGKKYRHIKLLDVNKNAAFISVSDNSLCFLKLQCLKTIFRRKIMLLRKRYSASSTRLFCLKERKKNQIKQYIKYICRGSALGKKSYNLSLEKKKNCKDHSFDQYTVKS